MNLLEKINNSMKKRNLPNFNVGDTVRVSVKIIEGEKDRTQDFEGVVIARSGAGFNESFTVRRISFGEGVERIFPLHSPRVQGIKVVRRGVVKRAKLYYIRDKVSKKATRIKEKAVQRSN